MEIKTVPKTIYEEVYVASDGMEFASAEACRGHEDDLHYQAAEEIVGKMPHIEICPPFCDGDDTTWYVYMVNSAEEQAAIRDYHYCSDAIADAYMNVPAYPCPIVASVCDDGYGVMFPWSEAEDVLCAFRKTVNDGMMKMAQAILAGDQQKEEEK